MRLPREDEQQLATFVLLDPVITGKERLLATRMERGDPMIEDHFTLIRQLAERRRAPHGFSART